MTLIGLAKANNLSDLTNPSGAWNNLGSTVTYVDNDTPYSISVKAADVLAISGVYRTRRDDLFQLEGLTSSAQNRISQNSANVASGVGYRDNSLTKVNPVSSGDYFLSRGVLSGVVLEVNEVPVSSLTTTPFSGSTAVGPITLDNIKLDATFRVSDAMPSGVLASGVKGVPVSHEGFILYLKAE